MPEMHGPGGIGGNELEIDLDTFASTARTVSRVLGSNRAKYALQCGIRELDVDEPRTRDLDGGNLRRRGDMCDDGLRDVARVHMRLFGTAHRHRACPITMRKVSRTLDLGSWNLLEGKFA